MAAEDEECTREAVRALVDAAEQVVARLDALEARSGPGCGVQRFRRKVVAERDFLESLAAAAALPKRSQVAGSNLSNLQAVVDVAERQARFQYVDRKFTYTDRQGAKRTVMVDLVVNGGSKSIKVTARNARGLHTAWSGEAGFGKRSIVDACDEILRAAKENPVDFAPPSVTYVFAGGVTPAIHSALVARGVTVEGEIVQVAEGEAAAVEESESESGSESEQDSSEEALAGVVSPPGPPQGMVADAVNLDVSCMIALVSELTNGDPRSFQSKDKVLHAMALDEQGERMLPRLQAFLEGKQRFVCATAMREFRSIVDAIAGDNERRRAEALLATVTEVPDEMSSRSSALQESARIKLRSKVVFGTGDTLRMVTATANGAFVRAAADQGVHYSAYVHPARALMETQAQRALSKARRKQNAQEISEANK